MITLEQNSNYIKVKCPECGCDYTYEIGHGIRECFECLNTFSISICSKCGNTGRCEPRTLSDPDGQECSCK